jgi:glycosyltransferase involved in cell wall biosynthesis
VFPSKTDTFGVVQLEALACGVPVAAYPVTGPRDVIGNHPVGTLDDDLRAACLKALAISRDACRAFALERSWENSAQQFIAHVSRASIGESVGWAKSPAPFQKADKARAILPTRSELAT